MDLKELKHDFQNNYLRLEVLLGMINDKLQKNEVIEAKYLEDLEKFLNLGKSHLSEIKKLN